MSGVYEIILEQVKLLELIICTKGGFDVSVIEEFTTSKYYKEVLKKEFDGKSLEEVHIAILEKVYEQLQEALNDDKEIILIDRSLNDRQIWNYRKYLKGEFSEKNYLEVKEKYKNISKELIDFLVITYADSLTSLKRDYLTSLSLEKRIF